MRLRAEDLKDLCEQAINEFGEDTHVSVVESIENSDEKFLCPIKAAVIKRIDGKCGLLEIRI